MYGSLASWLRNGCVAAALSAALIPTASRADGPLAKVPSVVLSRSVTPAAAPSADQVLHLVVSLPLRNMPGLDALLGDLYEPFSPNYRHYLSAAEFTDRFEPTPADYSTAVQYFAAQGMKVTLQTESRYLIGVDATVADVERVFHVKMGLYPHPTENRRFLSPDRVPTVNSPVQLQEVIGLNDFVKPHPKSLHHSNKRSSPGGSAPSGQLDGNDIRAAYYPSGTLTGAGQTIGLMEFYGLNVSDVALFFSNGYGPAAGASVPIKLISTDGSDTTCSPPNCNDDGEQALDVEYAISMAPGLAKVRVYVGSTAEAMLDAMATDNKSQTLSTSWGWDENFTTDDALFKRFMAQGQTNLTASGDYSSLSASGPWPEEDRHIIAVGGTDLAVTNGAWSSETGWSGSAGGVSLDRSILIEPYQVPYVTALNKGSGKIRNVPDIAASANTDMYFCANGSCQGDEGGTSFASPIWAGFIALANQYAVANGKPVVGFINPLVYSLGQNPNISHWFHDQTSGKSGVYSCTPSWDLVTGMGSPTGQKLIVRLSD